MIVDVHYHAWRFPEEFTPEFIRQAKQARAGMEVDLATRYEDYCATAPPETKSIVFGGKARLSGVWIDDHYVAKYVAADPERLIGFLSVDPTQPGWRASWRKGIRNWGCAASSCFQCMLGFGPTIDCLTHYGITPRVTNCRYCCTQAQRSLRRHPWNAHCRAISMQWQFAFQR